MSEEKKENSEIKGNDSAGKEQKKTKKKRSLFHRIVNWFLYFMLGIFVLLLIILGITQTSTFREYLRETVIEQANANLNGTVFIEKIEGTILTSLLLRNTVVNMKEDTLLRAELIEVKTSPLQLLLKKIKVRSLEIRNADISLIEDSSGVLNIIRLLPESEPDTTAAGEFPFKIEVADFRLTNVDFTMQGFEYVNSTVFYDSLNMKDFRGRNINLELSAFADISDNDYEFTIDHFSVMPNVKNFEVKSLTGDFILNQDEINIEDLILETSNSNVELSASMNNYNLFDSTAAAGIGSAIINASLDTGEFSFEDLIPFIPSMKSMRGKIASQVELSGTIDSLILDNIELSFLNSNLAASGSLKNLSKPESMYIYADFYDTFIDPKDLKQMMPALEIPGADQLGMLKFDILTYAGSPQNFKTNILMRSDAGTVAANGNLNFESRLMAYDLNLQTTNLNIAPFAGVQSDLNMQAQIVGKGTSPEELTANISLVADGSTVSGNKLDTIRFTAEASNKLINFDLLATSDSLGANIFGDIDFTNSENPAYVLEGKIRNLNVAQFTGDTTTITDLNITLNAEGENFDPELMNLYLSLTLFESTLNGINIDSTRAIVDLRKEEDGQRVINLISDLADVTLIGNFSVPNIIDLLSTEAASISKIINNKLNQIMPSLVESMNTPQEPIVKATPKNYVEQKYTGSNQITYLIDLKNVGLLSLFLGDNRIEVDGEMSGEIKNSEDSLEITFNAAIEQVKFWGTDEIFFVSNFNLDFIFANQINATSFDDIYTNLDLTTDRIFAGTDIHMLSLSLGLENEIAQLDFSTQLEDYADTKITGEVDLSGRELSLLLDTLRLKYNNYTLQNDSIINITYSETGVDIRSFVLARNGGNISINGMLAETGNQNLNISVNDLSGQDIAVNLFQLKQENPFDALINMRTKISGNFAEPAIDLQLNIDSVKYQNRNFGSLNADLDYQNKNLKVDIRFIDSTITVNKPALQVSGNIPIDMAFTGVEERFAENANMNISLVAENFNLQAFGDILPVVNNLRGNLIADLKLTGSPANLNPDGYIRLQDAAFIVEMNNLEYSAGLKTTITKDYISIDSLVIKNSDNTEDGGRMSGNGRAELDNMNITSSQFTISGDLKVLDDISKGASPSAYGNLVIGTRGNVEFIMSEDETKLTAPITIKLAELTIPPTQSAYQNTSANFIYKYVEDTTLITGTGPSFESLMKASKERSAQLQSTADKPTPFDFRIDIEIEDEATIIYVLSKELNQNLTAVLAGNIIYESEGGTENTQGELKLLEGSTLEFIKTLEADGTVRFENELANPNLNITATYLDYYYEESNGGEPEEIPVAVKIKVTGLLSELDKNFIQEENNIAVYYGLEDIQNNTPDPRFDASDAVYFIIRGDFVESASASPETDEATKQAYALAGSAIGGFLNRQTGGYVKSVQLRRVGSETHFNLSGRVNKFRYAIGGDQHVFQDLSQASVKIEYPVIENLLLRLERKQALNETSITNEMINELGLRYRFDF